MLVKDLLNETIQKRVKSKFSQEAIAKIAGISRVQVNRIENNIGNPTLKNIQAYQQAVMQVSELLSLATLNDFAHDIASNFALSDVLLFGSYATGLATEESDVDLIIAKNQGSTQLSLQEKSRIMEYAQKTLNKDVQLIDLYDLKKFITTLETRKFLTSIKNEVLRFV
ncbi:MAG: helix-turn-helix domain-containing protein [Lactobacillaceae bacterium]|jgi:transcriptional regulator with XRE-family HTH domain|nr:helix-turn-helix domain-containing protein [Lactobacillaceae bacterium]